MSEFPNRPNAVLWNKVFCWAMAITNIALVVALIWVIQNIDWLLTVLLEDAPTDIPEYTMAKNAFERTLMLTCIVGVVFAILNVWLAHAKETSAMYYIHLCNILLGLTTCVCIPIALPLLFAWFKPQVKAHFRVDEPNAPGLGR